MKQEETTFWDWFAALLTVVVVFTAAARLAATNWVPNLTVVETLTLYGALLGLALGASKFGRRTTRWMVFAYTAILLPWQLSQTIIGEETALQRVSSLGGRLGAAFIQLLSSKSIDDPLFFLTLMAALFWFIGLYSAYQLLRHPDALRLLVPSTLALLLVQYYDAAHAERIWFVAFFFFAALLLIGRVNIVTNRRRWEKQNVLLSGDMNIDLRNSVIVAAAVLVTIAWLLPTPAIALPVAAHWWKQASQPFDNTRQHLNNALAALRQPAQPGNELYGSTMGLGRYAGSGEDEVFRVMPPQDYYQRYYWRSRVYDTYQDGNWQATTGQNIPFDPAAGNLTIPAQTAGVQKTFTITWEAGKTTILTMPSQPLWASRAGLVRSVSLPDHQIDLLNLSLTTALQAGDQYTVHALMVNPTVPELEKAGTGYPARVMERYLQLPPDLSTQVRDLAQEITQNASTPYDKADKITTYLRENIKYSGSVPTAPPGVDPIDWFLFTWKSGFCNYYATAEVLMLRVVGVPARLAVGYAQGAPVPGGAYVVRGKDSHAWPEVYFPNIGWVEFEPTANQLPLIRSQGANDSQQSTLEAQGLLPNHGSAQGSQNGGTNGPSLYLQIAQHPLLVWVIILTGIILLGYGLWTLDRQRSISMRVPLAIRSWLLRYHLRVPQWVNRWVAWNERGPVERAFHAVNQSLAWLHQPQPVYATPAERAALLKRLLPSAAEDIDILAYEHEITLFSKHSGDPTRAAKAGWRIRFYTLRSIIRHRM